MDIFTPNIDLALLALRLALGIVFLTHGPAKLFKKSFSEISVGVLETVGALAVLLGLYAQAGAILLMVVTIGMMYFKTQKLNRNFTGKGGWEVEFVLLAAALAILIGGTGSYVVFL